MKKKNGFTLIELLSVIIILAIIALIATPIILGIVEDAKKDAFYKSVLMLINTTNMDITGKPYEDEYIYNVENGRVINLDIPASNIEGMNGSIIYNKDGKEIYAIHNGKYCVKKTDRMEKAEISDYVERKCIIPRNLLVTLIKLVPNEGNVVTSTNGQLINLGEYGIRYQGKNPDNYIYFNCSDYTNQTIETCELWRIIGVVDGNVKIMRSKSIGSKEWNEQVCDENGENCVYYNNWSNASLQAYLNGEYLTSMVNKNAATGSVIQASTWYLRGSNTTNVTKNVMYNKERTIGTLYGSNPEKIENTNIGLMYPSDYGYAAMENDTCLATTTLNSYSSCKESNWIAQFSSIEWLITAHSSISYDAFRAFSGGRVNSGNVIILYDVRPVLYLTSYTVIGVGDGTIDNPYILSME